MLTNYRLWNKAKQLQIIYNSLSQQTLLASSSRGGRESVSTVHTRCDCAELVVVEEVVNQSLLCMPDAIVQH